MRANRTGLSLGQIAREIGLARSTVQRIVAALATEDFVTEAQPGRGVRIGPGLARIAARRGIGMMMQRLALDDLARIALLNRS